MAVVLTLLIESGKDSEGEVGGLGFEEVVSWLTGGTDSLAVV